MGSNFFMVGILWVQFFLCSYFVGLVFFGFFLAYFVVQRFSVVCCMRKSDIKQKYVNASQTGVYSVPNRFQQLSGLFILQRYFIYLISYAIKQLSFRQIVFLVIFFLH